MAINLGEILKLLDKLTDLEKKVEEALANEADKKRRKKLLDAFKKRDLDALRDLLFD